MTEKELSDAIDKTKELNEAEKEELKKWLENGNSLSILVTGKTGAGKSSLLNYILGTSLFEVGYSKADPHTKTVSSKTTEKNGVKIVAWDSPGLQDGTSNEEVYLAEMVEHCQDVDLVLYCISMEELRSDLTQHSAAISKISRYFQQEIWANTLFVLTFANSAVDALEDRGTTEQQLGVEFDRYVQQWKKDIQAALTKVKVDKEIVDNIECVPAGHPSVLHLPSTEHWISNLWSYCLTATKKSAQPALIKMETAGPEGGFVSKDDVDEDVLTKATAEERKIVYTPAVKAAIGATAGGLVVAGTAVGAAIGGTIGALAIGIPSFGAAAGVGLGIGAGVGAAFGAAIATGVGALIALFRRHKLKKMSRK